MTDKDEDGAPLQVVAIEEDQRKLRPPGTLADFFAKSPLRDSSLVFARVKDGPRQTDL
jgi:hypothetical protein